MRLDNLKKRIKDILINEMYFEEMDYGKLSTEVYLDYRDEIPESIIADDICQSKNPREVFYDVIYENFLSFYENQNFGEVISSIRSNLSDEELKCFQRNENKIIEWLVDTLEWTIDYDHFNTPVYIDIRMDTGNANYDFACDNVFNYCGNAPDIPKESSLLWLAKQQKRATMLRDTVKKICGKNSDSVKIENEFVKSCIQEWANLSSSMGTLTFLVKVDLFKLFDLLEQVNSDEKGSGYITLGKETWCGLFDSWNGAGGPLEIELENDVVIPFKFIHDIMIEGSKNEFLYDVGNVYGLCGSCWKDSLKKIHIDKKERKTA